MTDGTLALATLAIETADPVGGVAFRGASGASGAADELLARAFDGPNLHAQRLVAMLAEMLPAGVRPSRVIVDRGPGSHTGVRIGLACARMLGWQTGAPVLGMSSLQVMARMSRDAGVGGALLVVLPCRGGHVYSQWFDAGGDVVGDEPCIVDVREPLPARWTDAATTAVGHALTIEPSLANLRTAGDAVPGWPTATALLHAGDALAATLPAEQWEATLSPLYLAPVLAKTRAEREAAGKQ
ncbi:MAG: tRNA (adenosine(37)-N6)-threonylcarbamoyltransferase complex dimerization subunit type 1 TsaB [Planctomycetota bacterium]